MRKFTVALNYSIIPGDFLTYSVQPTVGRFGRIGVALASGFSTPECSPDPIVELWLAEVAIEDFRPRRVVERI